MTKKQLIQKTKEKYYKILEKKCNLSPSFSYQIVDQLLAITESFANKLEQVEKPEWFGKKTKILRFDNISKKGIDFNKEYKIVGQTKSGLFLLEDENGKTFPIKKCDIKYFQENK